MKLISWNVNGLRACLTHDFAASFAALDADIFSVQETKMQPGQADFAPEGYTEYTYSAEKKGYSGTACWCRQPPLPDDTVLLAPVPFDALYPHVLCARIDAALGETDRYAGEQAQCSGLLSELAVWLRQKHPPRCRAQWRW